MATRRSARLLVLRARAVSPAPPAPAPETNNRKRTAAAAEIEVTVESAPATPKRRARGTSTLPASAAQTERAESPEETAFGKPRTPAVTRLADPRTTNAPLVSPMTSHLVAPEALDAVSPSKALGVETTTSANILEAAYEHLIRVDARMKPLIEKHPCTIFSPERLAEKVDPFKSLVGSIISQQVSGAAAASIKARFEALFDGDDVGPQGYPQPAAVAASSMERLRSAGLSQRKAEYIKGLAEKFCTGELSARVIAGAPYEELVERLVAVRGLGVWSVEMFAVFGLKRMDVCSMGDLGVQRGMAAFVGRDVAKLKSKGGKWKYMSEKEMRELSERFAPYRSVFMWYMWQILETDVSVLEKPS